MIRTPLVSRLIASAAIFAIALGVTFTSQAAETGKTEEGKYYLIYEVTVEKLVVGAAVTVEPFLLTDGERFVFAYDYCRQQYLRDHKPARAPYRYAPADTLDSQKVVTEDLAILKDYCAYRPVTLAGTPYRVRNAEGVELKLKGVAFEAPPLEDWYRRRLFPPLLPKAGKGEIIEIRPAPSAQKRLASEGQSVFLMSRDSSILDRVAPTSKVDEASREALLKRLEVFHDKFVVGKTIPAEAAECRSRDPEGVARFGWTPFEQYPLKARPHVAPISIGDFDGDSVPDFLVREFDTFEKAGNIKGIFELEMYRVVHGNGVITCVLQRKAHPPSSNFSALHVGSCRYIALSGNLNDTGYAMYLFPISEPSGACKKHFNSKLYEKVN